VICRPVCFEVGAGIHWRLEIFLCYTKKINVELNVAANEAKEVVAEFNAEFDRPEAKLTLLCGGLRASRSPTREHGRDRHSRIRSPLTSRPLLLSGCT
jgi:hypothetical protein